MCQESPGPRCFNDSSKKLNNVTAKLRNAEAALDAANEALKAAGRKSDFTTYSKLRKRTPDLEKKVESLRVQVRHTQRDIDSTLTGRKALALAIKNAKTTTELRELDMRRRTAEAVRFSREQALQYKRDNYVPVIRIAKAS